tara:strand:- start:610 stop:1140 length:531 start_codon:yes stop_codon:yes gene_type:complete
MIAVLLLAMISESSIEYTIEEHGPHTVYDGMVKLYSTEENKFPCFDYTFDVPEGCLNGSSISSDPGTPMIPFDWQHIDNTIDISWCRTKLPLHPFTGEDMQSYPIWTPRRFEFRITKTKFDGDDLGALLGDWGPPELVCPGWPTPCYTLVSPWDLNHDTNVDGADLLIILSNWEVS